MPRPRFVTGATRRDNSVYCEGAPLGRVMNATANMAAVMITGTDQAKARGAIVETDWPSRREGGRSAHEINVKAEKTKAEMNGPNPAPRFPVR